ncbi:uncharacterized protein LOC143637712 [Bidens hawaiensis]|uniref:uncharacterized protein LOC143637712 n=1 Tax=Bidens hawaiensis TaxID=980011 RepID=UPI0040491E89
MTTMPAKHHHQPLHNFSLPFLKWGHRTQSNRRHHHHRNSPPTDSSDSSDRTIHGEKENISTKPATDVAADGDVKPWNLRPRRLTIEDGNGGYNRLKSDNNNEKEKEKDDAANRKKKKKMKKKKKELWISLSKQEIEEDVYAFTGSRPARRPKKRNRTLQKQLDNVFPGLYLVGVSADSYRV